MRNESRLIFALSGLFAGTVLLVLAKPFPLLLVFGVGPAIVGSCVLAAVFQNIRVSTVRAVAAVLLSIPAYLLSFGGFAATASFFEEHGTKPSTLLSDLGPDIILGLVAAVVIASILLEGLAFLLSKRWSTWAAAALAGGGIGSVALAYAVKVAYFRLAGPPEGAAQIVILFGPLFIIGGAITATVIGGQVRGATQPRILGELDHHASHGLEG
jgi:hypothetical protein